MSEPSPSILSHVSIGTADLARAGAFYDKVLAVLKCGRVMEHSGAIAYGRAFPEFWIETPHNGEPALAGNGVHVSFLAASRAEVEAFYEAAMAAGAADDGAPGARPQYGAPYYACFIRDLDGNKIEAMFWDTALEGGD